MQNKKKHIGLAAWSIVHIAMLLLFLMARPWSIDTSLYSILPQASSLKNVSEAEKKMSEYTMSQLNVLIGHANFETAKEAADSFDSAFHKDSRLESISYTVEENTVEETEKFAYAHRFSMLDGAYIAALADSATGTKHARESALQRIYGAFGLSNLTHLEEDPYLLGAQAFDYLTLNAPVQSNQLTLKSDRLTVQDSTNTYILWSAKLSAESAGFANDGHVLAKMDSVTKSLKAHYPGLIIATSGVPFHSYESSKNAQYEITWISTVSVILALTLLIVVFRTALPIAATFFSIGMAVLSALAMTWTFFGEIHIFTFVFGTSIIGVSIDYAIHFFTDWRFSKENPDGFQVRRHILKSILLGFMTTELGYLALFVTPFPLLQQMALFSVAGLASALCSILLLFPMLSRAKKIRQGKILQYASAFSKIYNVYHRQNKFLKIGIPLALCSLLIPGLTTLNIHTDLRNLYTISDSLKESETIVAKLLNFGASGNYFIIKGSSPEDVLQKEEHFTQKLDSLKNDSLFKNYLAVSYLIHSQKKQSEAFEVIKKATFDDAPAFIKELGLESDSLFKASLDHFKPISFDEQLPSGWDKLLKMLWIGEVNGSYYSAVLPLHVKNAQALANAASGAEGIYFIDKMPEINHSLTKLSHIALILVAITDFIVFIIFTIIYNIKTALKIIRIPICATVITASIFGLLGIDFNFFAIVGVILTLGIGIDYALFFKESANHADSTSLAVSLSATTTILSFGTLAISNFSPVSIFGLAIFIGILSSFLLSPLTQNYK